MSPKFSELESGLLIDEHALDDALVAHADLYYHVAKQLADLISLRDEAKKKLAEVESEIEISIRHSFKTKDEKVTEAEIKSRVAIHKAVKQQNQELTTMQRDVGRYSALEKSFEARSRALGKLVDLYTAGYFGDVTHKRATSSMKGHKAEITRNRMNDLRQESKGK